MAQPSETYAAVWAVVARIPEGRVATYGQIATLAGLDGQPRLVGYALNKQPGSLPWHRVINAQGRISLPASEPCHAEQRARLESEGVEFDARSRVDLERFRWKPRAKRRTAKT